jgi:hypothetical protein
MPTHNAMTLSTLLLLFLSVSSASTVSLKASPHVLARSGDSVTLSWASVTHPCEADTISLFVEPYTHDEVGYVNASSALTWKLGHGAVSLPLVNVRTQMRFAYWSRCNASHVRELAAVHVAFADLFEPTQLHLALTHDITQMRVGFTTAKVTTAAQVPLAEVQALDSSFNPVGPVATFTGTSSWYAASDMCEWPANKSGNWIDPGSLHDVLMTGLAPASLYQYRVSVAGKNHSDWRPFVTAPPTGADQSVRVVLFGDMGVQTPFQHTAFWMEYGVEQQFGAPGSVELIERYVAEGVPTFLSSAAKRHFAAADASGQPATTTTTTTTQRLRNMSRRWQGSPAQARVSPRVVLDIGDISYARGSGVLWEYFMGSIDRSAGSAPFMVGVGNHEEDWLGQSFKPPGSSYGQDSLGECSVPYGHRFHMPSPGAKPLPVGRHRNMWYSFDFGPVHFVFMSSEHAFTVGSPQYQFIDADLAAVNRSVTPWVVLLSHRPFFTVSAGGFDELLNTLLREQIGGLARKYEVDIVFTGHVHTWERTCGIADTKGTCAQTDEDGTVYIVGGCAGNDYQGAWMNLEVFSHVVFPDWSVFVTVEHGISEMQVNGTHLELIYVSSRRGEVHDRLVLDKAIESKK